jgi:outer membrane receptor protein involved in Fe transport
LAYNWRDEFLTATTDGNGIPNPMYVEEYGQVDGIISYTFEEYGVTLFLEGFNLTDEYARTHSRRPEQVEYVTQLGSRYGMGLRWVF